MDRTLTDPLVGRILDGRYRVESRIARGGMATVYLALDLRLERTIALKVMHGELAGDPEFVRRFIREAKATASLSHPNIVGVFDQGIDDRHVYLAMEYVPGRTLRDLLRERGHLGQREALELMVPVLAALGAAHAAGIIHRDVKPENVLLTGDGRIKVVDFGLSRAIAASNQTKTGLMIGTIAYMAPEQMTQGASDARTDVYAAGIMLFELLTGHQPYAGESPMAVAYRHVNETVPAPSTIVPGVHPGVDALIASATDREPDRRPKDAGALLVAAVELHRAIPGGVQPIPAPSPGPAPRPRPAGGVQGGHTLIVSPAELGDLTAPHPPRRTLTRGRWPIPAAAAVLALVVGVAGWLIVSSAGYLTVPADLVGKSVSIATELARRAGFEKVVVGAPEPSTEIPKNNVVRVNPAPGTEARASDTLTLIPSSGPPLAAVPGVAGKPVETARAELTGAGFVVGQVENQASATVPRGEVIGTDPKEGARIPVGSKVKLLVSSGITMPALVGTPRENALTALRNIGVNPHVQEQRSEAPRGQVIAQIPVAGSPLAAGQNVVIVVSAGNGFQLPDWFPGGGDDDDGDHGGGNRLAVPNVMFKSISQARSELRGAGFRVKVKRGLLGGDLVTRQSKTGTAPRGSVITIWH
ncbi:Stk1 family PASTA domain-containing Ser/Thr kinase [Rhizohabitans arisaemae]|uniref:Stk1 family PASTA domain-containing Ser/Thr kinase n=1 Tax=Rhizohabitans arisaemae TaxID=2720610 RepID=UPI0024B15902|nr:Stk1 family PASTA domain-containing Ser/Thr kinase [Rhizohabitans arisaemae]